MTKAQIISVARQGREGEAELRGVLATAQATDDRHLFGICLDCVASVLRDSDSEYTRDVVDYLGRVLMDPAYKRIRPRMLRTLIAIGPPACRRIFPQMLATYLRRGTDALRVPARWAVITTAWYMLESGDDTERAEAIAAFEQLKGHGRYNLQQFLILEPRDPAVRSLVEAAIIRMERK